MNMWRPAYKITKENPGTELAGETSAAMSAASILFKDVDAGYAAKLVDHAKQLFDFADEYRGHYHHSITDAKDFYKYEYYLQCSCSINFP